MSAACLLERYLEDCGIGALDATPCPFPPPADVAMFDYNTVKSYVRSLYYSEDNSIDSSISWMKSQSQRKVLLSTVCAVNACKREQINFISDVNLLF